ncbi:IS3 family transposase [Catalinimonas alkaloidigena]|uniref:IS3 family transposase n=1 Tax=Catalinimonas alkaloidigena TaxID=1075417 RepID=UPI003B8A6CBF
MKRHQNAEESQKKRTQRDYTLGFKLSVLDQVEKGELSYKQAQQRYGIQGRSTVLVWLRKHGKLDWSKPSHNMHPMPKSKETPAQKIKRLEKELADEKARNLILNRMIDISDKEYGTAIRKKFFPRATRELQQERQVSLASSCSLFGVSRQAIYQGERRYTRRTSVLLKVKELVVDTRRRMPRIGTRKLYYLLSGAFDTMGVKIGRDGLFSYLRQERLLIKPRKKYTKTTDSKHWLKKYPNLYQDKVFIKPERCFVSDITYVKSSEGIHYLSLVTDVYSRKIMGYHLSKDMSSENVVKALQKAVSNKMSDQNTIHHSDRGLQYCSEVYQKELRKNKMISSMTEGYDCYQNALAERVNGILKDEFLLHKCNTFNELSQVIDESIKTYNHERPHLSLGYQTPEFVHQNATEEYLQWS